MPTRVKAILVLMTIAGLGIFVSLAFIGGGGSGCTTPDAIVRVFPDCNESVFQQSYVEVVMANGYRAELALNNQPIPLDEISTDQGGDDIAGAVPNRYRFQPGEGKTVEALEPNQNCVAVTYWPIASGMEESREFRWCFRAA